MSTSIEKIAALERALVLSDEEFEGLLGAVQGVAAVSAFRGQSLAEGIGDDPAAIDEELVKVAGFVLWLRSDDAFPVDSAELVNQMPAEIAALVQAAGIA